MPTAPKQGQREKEIKKGRQANAGGGTNKNPAPPGVHEGGKKKKKV